MTIDLAKLRVPDDLPIAARADEIVDALRTNQVVVIAGETGSGKSTQLPKLCLRAGRGTAGIIGHTQPRRVAARTIADRVASEVGVELGAEVGFSVRFNDVVSDVTQICVMTDGILLAELQRDPQLSRYDTIIVDEAHERSLNVDFILGYLRRLLIERRDLHLVVTSATIDTERFAQHFADEHGEPAPVFIVEGRTFPVDIRHHPIADEVDQVQAILDEVVALEREVDGDVLVFLSGEREIHDTAEALRGARLPRTEILPLYARLSAHEQHRVFASHPGRRIILATNVAETSITVPGVRAVIDAGTARVSRYSKRLKVQRLPIEEISQASAAQRAGRCGRIAPGICVRLWSEENHLSRPAFTEPEILRTNLASVILQMTSLRLGPVEDFPFIDMPDRSSINDGYRLLIELGAIVPRNDDSYQLTKIGRKLARLPVDPRIGRMVIEAHQHGCVREVLVIAAALSIQDVRERPHEHREKADELHKRFAVEGSDLMSTIALWDYLRDQQRELSGNGFRRMCRDEFLNWLRVREWRDLYSQLRQVAGEIGVRPGTENSHPDRIHQAVLVGLLSQVGRLDERQRSGGRRRSATYAGARGSTFEIAPGSVLSRAAAPWVMASELVETDVLRARRLAAIEPRWIEHAGRHLVTRSYGEPEWDSRGGRAVVHERVSLYGLSIVANRRIALAPLDGDTAWEMFIEHALVRGEVDEVWRSRQSFVAFNDERLRQWNELGERTRRGSPGGRHELRSLYQRVVPRTVCSLRDFDRWWKDERLARPAALELDELPHTAGGINIADFPDVWADVDGAEYELTYRHDSASPFDGVTVHVPLTAINRFDGSYLDWHIPGRRNDLAAAYFRTLSKDHRRQLIPAADTLTHALDRIGEPHDRPFVEAFAEALSTVSGHRIRPTDFRPEQLPTDLIMHIVVSDAEGEVHAFGDDVASLRELVRPAARSVLAAAAPIEERTGIQRWDIGDLPRVVEWSTAGETLTAYPTLLDRGDSVSLRLVTSEELADRLLHEGVRRLLLLTTPPARGALRRLIDNPRQLALSQLGIGPESLLDDAITCVADSVIERLGSSRSSGEFQTLVKTFDVEAPMRLVDAVVTGLRIVDAAAAIMTTLERLRAPAAATTRADAHDHLRRLVGVSMLSRVGERRLADLERWVAGIAYRLSHLAGHVDRDIAATHEVQSLESLLDRRLSAFPAHAEPPFLREIGFDIEEVRISLFAQDLGVRQQVSAARVRRALNEVQR